MKLKLKTKNLNDTQNIAKAFAKMLTPPMIVILRGDLGAGKTTFVKYVAQALGCKDNVTSPTFTLQNTYDAMFPVYHFDMYRLSSAEEAMGVGFEEYFDKDRLDGVCFVEWEENVAGLIKNPDIIVSIQKDGENERTFLIEEAKDASN